MKKFAKVFIPLFTIFAVAAILLSSISEQLPDTLCVIRGETPEIASRPYIDIYSDNQAVAASTEQNSDYVAQARLFGVVPIKKIEVSVVEQDEVILCGSPLGVKLYSRGVIVTELSSVILPQGAVNPGELAGLKPGDIIEKVNGKPLADIKGLIGYISGSEGSTLTLTVLRGGDRITVRLTPVYSEVDGSYKAGLWVRDSTAGIGMLTYIDPVTSVFGGLGHAICDSDTGVIMPVGHGEITDVMLTDVQRGAVGTPGELVGFLGNNTIGDLLVNSEAGVYGIYYSPPKDAKCCKVAMKQSVKEGKAQLLTTLPGENEAQLFDIVIEKINFDEDTPTRNMIIQVTDKRLIEATGGIVQGMSGSPIIQDGKFVAAATHVFVNDPTRGYAIFSENMIKLAKKSINSTENMAS